MAEKLETVADILAERREWAKEIRANLLSVPARRDDQLARAECLERDADRIEAAHRREIAEAEASALEIAAYIEASRHKPTGNAAAMREALARRDAIAQLPEVRDCQCVKDMRNIIAAALAAPPRNCDVGTPEEQDKRFSYMFCRVGIEGCINCKLDVLPHRGNTCGIHWANMPYEGEAKEGGEG